MSIWDQYPNYSDDELRLLVSVTAEVLQDAAPAEAGIPEDLLDMSPASLAKQLKPLLEENQAGITQEQVRSLLEDPEHGKALSLAVLEEARKSPELAERIADAYDERRQKMASPELILLVGALVILAIKLKEIKLSKKETKISFFESSTAVKGFAVGMINNLLGKGS